MDLKGKRLLVLGGAIQHLQAVKAAKESGVHVIVTDIQKETEAKMIADEALDISVMDSETLIDWCKKNPVDGVLNFNIDFAQHSHQKICSEFGLPGYGNSNQYAQLTNKLLFKELCNNSGVDTIQEYSNNSLNEVVFPVLVKPAESSGSRGAVICNDLEMLKKAYINAKKASRNGNAIIERYMGGYPDIEVVYFVRNRVPHLMWVGDRYLGKKKDGLHRQCVCFSCPTKYMQTFYKNVHPRICNMIKKLGLINSPVFFQGIVDKDYNTVRFYDPGIRFPGDEFGTIFKQVTGIDLMKMIVEYALTGEVNLTDEVLEGHYMLEGKRGTLFQLQAKAGTITFFEGLDVVRELPEVVAVAQKKFVGDHIINSGDLSQRIGEIAIVSTDIYSTISTIEKAKTHLTISDENGNNMLISSFDTDSFFRV